MPRSSLRNEPSLLDVERALRLVEDATALHRSFPELEDSKLATVLSKLPHDAALLALETAADTGDPRVLAAALDLAVERVRWDDDPTEFEIATIADVILPNVTAIDNLVRECARSKSSTLRAYTGSGLGERALRSMRGEGDEVDAEAAAIVYALAKDENSFVRKCAREALGGAAPPAWAPFFARDPLAAHSAAEAAILRGPLDRAGVALEERVRTDATPLAEAIAELPDDLAAPILDAWMRETGGRSKKGAEPLLERWLSLDGERLVAFAREADFMEIHAARDAVAAALRRRKDAGTCMRLAHLCLEIGERDASHLAAVTDLLAAAWPEEADPTALLELGLGAPLAEAGALEPEGDPPSYVHMKLREIALAPRPGLQSLHEPLAGALIAGFPGRWHRDADTIRERLMEVRHAGIRAHAEACLRADDPQASAWALRYLVAGGHDPDRDPPPAEMLREAMLDPRLRAPLLKTPALAAHGVIRAQLTEIEPEETITLASALLTAGQTLDSAEWDAVRRARAKLRHPRVALQALPGADAWTDEDGAFLEAVLEENADDPPTIGQLLIGLMRGVGPETVAIVERFVARIPSPFDLMVQGTLTISRHMNFEQGR